MFKWKTFAEINRDWETKRLLNLINSKYAQK